MISQLETYLNTATININGQILPGTQAKVSVFDRSYLYGDSLYEVARTYKGKFFLLDEHLDRLEKSAVLCKIKLSQTKEFLKKEIYKTYSAYQKLNPNKPEAYCRLIISRGVGKIGFSLGSLLTETQMTILLLPVEDFIKKFDQNKFEEGLHLGISKRLRNDPRALDPAMKSGNYLNNLLAFLETRQEFEPNANMSSDSVPVIDDALLLNHEGFVTEGTTFNIFYTHRKIIATPPLKAGILAGITRAHVLSLAKKLNLEVREVYFPPLRLFEADEVFVTSSLKEVFPVTQIDGKRIQSGKPGSITRQLQSIYQESVHSWLKHYS